jgi:hypothetical protein
MNKKYKIILLFLLLHVSGLVNGCGTTGDHVGGLIIQDDREGSYGHDSSEVNVDRGSRRISYIDKDLLPHGEITEETTCVYRIMIIDSILAEGSEKDFIKHMKSLDYTNCPDDFRVSHKKHINAWERRNTREINKTWDEILKIAEKYGVVGH